MALEPAVGVVDAHQHVGDRGLEPRDAQRLAREPALTVQRAAHQHGARGELLPVGGREAAALRDNWCDPDLDLAAGRPLPQQRVRGRIVFSQFKEAGAGLVRVRSVRHTEREPSDKRRGEQRGRDATGHHDPPFPVPSAGLPSSVFFSITTLYFASSRSYIAASCRVRRSDANSRSTAGRTRARSGSAPATRSRTSTRCSPKPDWMGPAHVPGASASMLSGEVLAERPGHVAARGEIDLLRQHDRIAEVVDPRPGARRPQPREERPGVGLRRRPAPVPADVDLPERHLRLDPERVGVPGQPRLQLLLGRRRRRDDVLDHELQLLPQPAADHRVVAVEPHRHRLAHGDLLAHPVVDQALDLDVGGRALPGLREPRRQLIDLPRGQHDPAGGRARTAAVPVEIQEQRRPDREEVQQGLPQDGLQAHRGCIVADDQPGSGLAAPAPGWPHPVTACTRSARCRPAPGASSSCPGGAWSRSASRRRRSSAASGSRAPARSRTPAAPGRSPGPSRP